MATQVRPLLCALCLVLSSVLPARAWERAAFSNLRLVTSVPENDYSPSLTSDGKWAVFVSERTGDSELFATQLAPDLVSTLVQLAPSPGDDFSPHLSPDGKWLAWISTREDAFGDTWVMRFPDGKPIQVSNRGMRDSNPRWEYVGKDFLLVYDSLDMDGARRVMAAKPGEWAATVYTGRTPWSSIIPPFDAHIVELPDGAGQPWVLVTDDTNGDGRFDAKDKRAAWITTDGGRTWRQLTPPLQGLNSPRMARNVFILSFAMRDDLDIATVESPFPIASVTNALDALEMARCLFEDMPSDPFTPAAYYRQAFLLDPNGEAGFVAMMEASDLLQNAQRPEQALSMLAFAEKHRSLKGEQLLEMAYRKTILELDCLERGRPSEAVVKSKTQAVLAKLEQFANVTPALSPSLRARITIEIARIQLKRGNPGEALAAARRIELFQGTPRRLQAQSALLRGDIYKGLADPGETVRAYRTIVANYADQADIAEDAAIRLADIAAGNGSSADERILALQRLHSDDLPGVRAAAGVVAGELMASSGDTTGATNTWSVVVSMADKEPRLAARAAFKLGGLLARLGEYQKAIEVFDSIATKLRDQLFGGAPTLYRQARQGRISEYLAKGNYELQVGDTRLALTTFSELVKLEPVLVEAWRGLLEAQSRCGLLDSKQLAQYKSDAAKTPANALSQYIYGLAMTYQKTIMPDAVSQLERAILLDGAVPFFHQTLGFVHEHFGRVKDSREDRALALQEYERALALLAAGGDVRTVDYARLLINSGNAALAVGSHQRAADLYERRLEMGVLFDNPANEFLMYRADGIALSRSSRPNEAIRRFEQATALIPRLLQDGFMSKEQAGTTVLELRDRTALALLNAGRYVESASAFSDVALAAQPRSSSQVRALRSHGFALHRLSQLQTGMERETTLTSAAASLHRALGLLEGGLIADNPAQSTGGGIFKLTVSIPADKETGGAALELSPAQEKRLILAALSRIMEDLGLHSQAVASLKSQMATPVSSSDENIAYYMTARLVALDRLASELQKTGRREEAAKTILLAITTARYEARGELIINGNALSLSLARLTELALSSEKPPFVLKDLTSTWLFKSIRGATDATNGTLRCMEAGLRVALELRNSSSGEYNLQWGVQHSRVMLARALLLERLSEEGASAVTDTLAGITAAGLAGSARQLASAVIDAAESSREGGEVKKLALFAHALIIRQAMRQDDHQDAALRLEKGLQAADRYGFPELRWWLTAQGVIASGNPVSCANAALVELESLSPVPADNEAPVPLDLVKQCERISIAAQISSNAWENAWSLTERWRIARLRMVFSAVEPGPRLGDADDKAWLESAIALRRQVQRCRRQIREQSVSGTTAAEFDDLARATSRLQSCFETGRAGKMPGALLLYPQPAPFEDASILLENDQRFQGGAALVLSTAGVTVAWTNGGFLRLEAPANWSQLAQSAHVWFMMGDRLPADRIPKDTAVVNMLTFESTFARAEQPSLSVDTGSTAWPGQLPVPPQNQPAIQHALAGANDITLTIPVAARGTDPTLWRLAGSALQTGIVLESMPAVGRLSMNMETVSSESKTAIEAMEEALVAAASATGAAAVELDGRQWLAPRMSVSAMPELAEAWIAADSGKVKACIERGETAGAVAPLQRVLALRTALKKPFSEIAEAADLLARIEGKLERWDRAARAASQAVDILLPHGDSQDLAVELSLYGSFLNDARLFERARSVYLDAAGVYKRLNDTKRYSEMIARSGVALENDGRFNDALASFAKAASVAETDGDKAVAARQMRRKGRIYLQRQNRYADAEVAFSMAADLATVAGATQDALLARLDVARVRERLGSYADSIEISSQVASNAVALNLPQLQADALLVRAFVQWASADYFNAFKSVKEALRIADDIKDDALRIVGHNTAGLIAWALNDTEGALKEFDSALKLARSGLFNAEIASTLNNRGLVYRSRAEYEEALAEFGAALAIDRTESNTWGIAYSQRNIGLTYIQRGEPDKSMVPLQEAIRLAANIGDRANMAKAFVAIGDACRAMGQTTAAQQYYIKATAEARAIPLPEVEWRALYGTALLARAAKDNDTAKKYFAYAIAVVERLRASIRIEELQDGFLLDKQSLYDEMVRLLLDQGSTKDAFEFSERSRGRNFIDMLGSQKMELKSEVDQASIDRESKLRSNVEALARRVSATMAAEREKLETDLAEARRVYSDFLIELRANNPQLSSFVSVPAMELATLQNLLDKDTRLIVYHVLPDQLVAWVIGSSSLNVVRTPVKRTEMASVLGAFRRHIQHFDDVATEERMLSAWLITPVEPLLTGATRIGVIPHRELHQMPFSATRLGDGYIIDKYSLFYAPSASVIQYTFARRSNLQRNDKVLAIGNPDLGTRSLDLPFAEKEAQRLKWSFPDAKVVTGREATESWVARNIGDYGIIHIASHGEYNEQLPLLSAVKLAPDDSTDGNLTTRKIFGLSIKADLIALSACQTGLGRVGSGDDIVGLNRAFVYAGTHEILSSLWRVDDVATAILIKYFYRNLAGRNRAEALRQAQLEVRSQYRHPAYWAGLFLSGDWQ